MPGAGGQASTEKCSWHDDVSIQGVWRGSKGDNDLGVGEEKEIRIWDLNLKGISFI